MMKPTILTAVLSLLITVTLGTPVQASDNLDIKNLEIIETIKTTLTPKTDVLEVIKPKSDQNNENKKPRQYKVVDGDNLTKIAQKHKVDWRNIWDKNLNIKHPDDLTPGQKLKIPDPDEDVKDRKIPDPIQEMVRSSLGEETNRPVDVGFRPVISGNTYAPGYCTWYVKNQRPDIPNGWHNAYQWYGYAQAQGWPTGSEPRVGAVAWAKSYNHVAIVTGVSGDTVTISEMNAEGLYVVSSRTSPKSEFLYIY